MSGLSDKAIEAANRAFGPSPLDPPDDMREVLAAAYPIIRADLLAALAAEFKDYNSDSEDVFLFAQETRERIRAEAIAEVVQWIREGGADAACHIHPLNVADTIERELLRRSPDGPVDL